METKSAGIYQQINPVKQALWRQYTGSLPMVDVVLNHQCLGNDFGVYAICTGMLTPGAIIYSFGVGKDISFEKELHQIVDCEFHLFDPTPESIEWINHQYLPDHFSFHPYGLSISDQLIRLFPPNSPKRISHSIIKHKWASDHPIVAPAKSLPTIAAELNHHRIDVLKMDIEGAEYEIIEALFDATIRPEQIIVEFHHHYPEIGLGKTQKAISQLKRLGYQLFAFSNELEEFSFVLNQHISVG